jgi:uncharacterized protein YukE
MSTETVKSTPESVAAAAKMVQAVQLGGDGALQVAIRGFQSDGDIINDPTFYEGTAAAGFRSEWPGVRSALDNVLTHLQELADNVAAVNGNIQTAGGNQ